MSKYFAYLARCSDGSLYAGYTNDIAGRERAHNVGEGARYTKARRPVKIVYFEEFANRSEAMKREAALKRLKKIEKEKLLGRIPGCSKLQVGKNHPGIPPIV
ncbi:GIY-YIG nuclease family protein [Candidatus Peregrinibacteria bacterium]|nr:GIY-YIG nuclease family protein [Candidatus Peregrinibacteria bacterium]